ncbi:TrkA family potassium uptake protein [Maritimibacter sp. UBA3975]|uniref:potassium channel family protein n=1 Tax=Maritimibacter sp. UBA3975 TaxID=1946833 RepID=UPI000C0A0F39|nr:TrkA family potassium uptake protein [Maritimibacter sp. UBA3975]MAM62991.1 potassium transporter [Maritimibacter sp.]
MRIVIVGASRFGVATAEQLIETGHTVVLVDTDREKLDQVAEDLDCGMLHGDGSLPTVQREAFGDHADALILLTNTDDVNIMAAVVGRSVGFERVVPQIVRSELVAVCEELGLDDLVTPHQTLARSLLRMLEDHSDAALELRFRNGLTVRGYSIGDRLAGCAIGDLDLPDRCRVMGVAADDDERLGHTDTVLEKGNRLIVVVEDEIIDDVDAIFEAEGSSDEPEDRKN